MNFQQLSVTVFSSGVVFMASCKAHERSHDILASAWPALQKVGIYIDKEVLDKVILTTCAGTGGVVGHSLNISLLKWYYGPGVRFDHTQHLEDDIGWYVGVAAGYKFGEFAVKVRHTITDPIFSSTTQLTLAVGQASKRWVENLAESLTQKITSKMNGWAIRLNGYANTKKS